MNLIDAEFIQYLNLEGSGPSSKTCPKCESPYLLRTSILLIPYELSSFLTMYFGSIGFVKLGHPVPDSNLSVELNKGSPETIST